MHTQSVSASEQVDAPPIMYPVHLEIECELASWAAMAGLAPGSLLPIAEGHDLRARLIAGGACIGGGVIVATDDGIALLIE